MTPGAIKAALKVMGAVEFDDARLPWVTTNCLLAPWDHEKGTDSNPSLGFLSGQQGSRGYCFSCKFSGTLEDMAARLKLHTKGNPGFSMKDLWKYTEADDDDEPLDLSDAGNHHVTKDPIAFPEAWLDSFPRVEYSKDGSAYLKSRGFSMRHVVVGDVRWDPNMRNVCVPYRGFDGKLYGMRGRAVDPDAKARYHMYDVATVINTQVMMGEDTLDLNEPVVVVEGFFDFLRTKALYPNTACMLSSGPPPAMIERLGDAFMVLVMSDGDKAGAQMFYNLRKVMKDKSVLRVPVPFGSDPGEMSDEAILQAIGGVLGVDLMEQEYPD